MEEKNSSKVPENPSKRSDLIILTPDELSKLGLFKNVDITKMEGVDDITGPNIIINKLKQKIKDSIKSSLKSTEDLQDNRQGIKTNKTEVNKAEALAALGAKEPENSASTSQGSHTVLNLKSSQSKPLHSQTLLLDKIKNDKLGKHLSTKDERKRENIPAKILNSEFKFEKCNFILAQKKNIEKFSNSKIKLVTHKTYGKASSVHLNKEISNICEKNTLQNRTIDSVNKNISSKSLDPKMSNSRFKIVNKETGTTVEQVDVECKSINEIVNKKFENKLTKSEDVKNIPKIEDLSKIQLDSNSPSTSRDKNSSVLENSIQNNKNILEETIINNNKLVGDKSIILRDLENSDKIYINNNKKREDVNIVSNIPVHFSNEELNKLVSVAKSKPETTGLDRLISSKKQILSPQVSEKSEKEMITSDKTNEIDAKSMTKLEKNSIVNNSGQKNQKALIPQSHCNTMDDISKTNNNLENQMTEGTEKRGSKILSTRKKIVKGPIKYLIKKRHKETNVNTSTDDKHSLTIPEITKCVETEKQLEETEKYKSEGPSVKSISIPTENYKKKEADTDAVPVKMEDSEDNDKIYTTIDNPITEEAKENVTELKTVTQISKQSCDDKNINNTNDATIHICGKETDSKTIIKDKTNDTEKNISKDENTFEAIQHSIVQEKDAPDKPVEVNDKELLNNINKETDTSKEDESKLVIGFKDCPETGKILNKNIYDEYKKDDSTDIASSPSLKSKCNIEKDIDVTIASTSAMMKDSKCNKEFGSTKVLTPKGSIQIEDKISIPKKRGRPKKVIDLNNSDATSKNSNLQLPSDENQSLSEVKKELDDFSHSSQSPNKNNSNIKTEQLSEVISDVNPEQLSDKGTPAKLPRKRGRPKKIQNLEETEKESSSSLPSKINDADVVQEEKQMSTPLPRKRGRKRKSDLPPVVVEEIVETFETSKSGRKRKKIDYFELENNIEEGNNEGKKRRKQNHHTDYENSFEITKNDSSNNSSNKSSDKVSVVIKEEETNVEIKNETISSEAAANDSHFSKSGNALMMNSIFHAAVRNNSNIEEDSGGDIKQPLESHKPKKRGRKGKEYKADSLENFEIDQDNMVKCVRCNKKVNNEEWSEHNRKLHCNLSWREGEQELNFDNKKFISNILMPILQEEKILHCTDCQKTYSTVNDFSSHIDECRGILSSDGTVICAICNQSMVKRKWTLHKQNQHNNLAWRHGDPPLDLNNQALVIGILTVLYRAKKPLYCFKCKTSKKSVVGFLSHQSQCGLSAHEAKVPCEICGRKVLPVSMATHIKLVHETPKLEPSNKSTYFEVEMDAISTKRRAATTAMQVIDQFTKQETFQERGQYYIEQLDFAEESFVKFILQKQFQENQTVKCKFKDCELEYDKCKTLINHMNCCERKPTQYYTCKKCLFITEAESEISEHLNTLHKINTTEDNFKVDGIKEEDENDDEEQDLLVKEMKKRKLVEKKKSEKDINYKIKPTCLLNTTKQPGKLFYNAFSYTIDFCEENFSKTMLFNHLRNTKSNWLLLEDELIEAYLPKSGESCEVAKKITNCFEGILEDEFTFKKFELFETQCEQGTAMIFCGGPINAMAWLPTPYTSFNYNQILAVATGKDFDAQYKVGVNYKEQSVIQFWDFGALRNKNHDNIAEPQLLFCLTYVFGPVWHMEWCPSGCCDNLEENESEEMSRMGLLAVAGSDSVVHIYSIPFIKTEEKGLIYSVKPLLKLCLVLKNPNFLGPQNFFATKISWSKASGHRYIAVGYTNGMVALFDLECTSKLLCYLDEDGVNVLLPYKSFQAHTDHITALTLLYLGGGNRWLFTGSFDHYQYTWDLYNDVKITEAKKHVISDGVWLTNWIANITGAEESSTKYAPVNTCLTSCRDYLYDHVHMTTSPTTIKSLSSSDWLNSILQGNAAGEITGLFPYQLLYSVDSKKHFRSFSYIFGYTRLIDLHKSPKERIAEETEKIKALKSLGCRGNKSDKILLSSEAPYFHEPLTYEAANKKYGLVFCDMKMKNHESLLKATQEATVGTTEKLGVSKANLYPLKAINIVSYNPNLQASLYFATGYQAGFVRLTYIKLFERDKQIK